MYLDHFGLQSDPFPLYPSLKFVFLSTPFEEAMAHLAYGLEQAEDIVLITGPIGTGKTLAVQSLLANVAKSYQTAFVNVTQVDYPELLKLILADLGAPYSGPSDRADLLTALMTQVRAARARGQKILIVVDEAQNLSVETLEGLRLLTNLGQPQGQALQLVLVGQPDLERKIELPALAQLRQRIRVHYRLETLNRKEIEAYIAHRLKVAGCDRPVFKSKAVDLIHGASSGVPRLVNIIASRALISAYVAGKREIDPSHIDLDDLPLATGVGDAPAAAARPAAGPAARSAATVAPAEPPAPPAPVAPPAPAASAAPPPRTAPPADAPPPARAAAQERIASPAGPPSPAPAARPFSPTTEFRRQNRRSGLYFVLALLLLVIGAFVVFTLKPGWGGRGARPAAANRPATIAEADSGGPAPASPGTVAAARPDSGAGSPAIARADSVPASTSPPVATGADPGVQARAVPAPSPARAPAAGHAALPPSDDLFAVHVHSFQDMERTLADIAELQKDGFPAYFRVALLEGVEWQRVYAGPYATHAAAEAAAQALRNRGVTTYALVVRAGGATP